ncbi:MAG: universal stress protein [bacterium]|nr:universal stress protein [bacterium]MCP5042683.1 universal stress protein [bacterium]
MKFEKILVPVDFSGHSEQALKLALALVGAFEAELHLVHVFPESLALAPPYGPVLPADFGMQIERSATDHFEQWQKEHVAADVALTSYVRRGDPSRRICELAEEIGADLIVMGTRGTTGLEHVLMGSVAERTVRTADCPVLTTKGDA